MNQSFIIRDALPEEAGQLSLIAQRAKAHWGYAPEQINLWRGSFLTVTADYIAAHQVWVAVAGSDRPVGFAALEHHEDGVVLEHLWVLPGYMGRGIGAGLMARAANEAPAFTFTSDPHADAFYYKLGARKVGEVYSARQGIILTRFVFRKHGNT